MLRLRLLRKRFLLIGTVLIDPYALFGAQVQEAREENTIAVKEGIVTFAAVDNQTDPSSSDSEQNVQLLSHRRLCRMEQNSLRL
ncbi:hypothetical protein QR680_008174 [Steinernema hermaphroditum]|uniref:Uncharacterized protein n=1 Tax=Steinernema hermaphroditum TaxID=289476 RepID=A0AA39IH33_9BILA|nr:hypothetical protein QR680_008174 [Steinernema hermaphroditum]